MARRLLPLSTAPPTPDAPAPVSGQRRKRPNGILAVACLACQKRKTKVRPCSHPTDPVGR